MTNKLIYENFVSADIDNSGDLPWFKTIASVIKHINFTLLLCAVNKNITELWQEYHIIRTQFLLSTFTDDHNNLDYHIDINCSKISDIAKYKVVKIGQICRQNCNFFYLFDCSSCAKHFPYTYEDYLEQEMFAKLKLL